MKHQWKCMVPWMAQETWPVITITILDTKVYTKPTETYQFLHRTSSHPPHVFKAFIYGETLRYARNTNNEDDFTQKVKVFSQKLLTRGYTQTEINNATHKVSLANPAKLTHNLPKWKQNMEASLVFSTTYNPFVNHKDVKQAIDKHWHLIQQNP